MTEQKDNKTTLQRATTILEQFLTLNGYSRTPERFAVLATVCQIDGFFTAKTLYEMMHTQKKMSISLATIYSTLILLEESHLVVSHHFDRHTVSYESAITKQGFKYAVCTKCGKVRHIESSMLDKCIKNVKTPRFHVNNYAIYIYGVCASCASLQKRKELKYSYKTKQQNKLKQ